MNETTDQYIYPINSIISGVLGIRSSVIERTPSPNDLTNLSVVIEDRVLEYAPDGFPRYAVHLMWKREEIKNINGGEIILNYFSGMGPSGMISGQYPNYLGSYLKVNGYHSTQIPNHWESLMSYLILTANINKAAKELTKKGLTEGIDHIVRANSSSSPYFERAMKDGVYKYCYPDGSPSENKFKTIDSGDVLYVGKFPSEKLDYLESRFLIPNLVSGLIRTRGLSLEESSSLLSSKE